MSDTIIKVENISKRYLLGQKHGYKTFRESLVRAFTAPFSRAEKREEVWALKDVSFEVKKGEALGIIGRNGAGKSTLLKILSRITEPTSGYAELNGRVGSLLEVGTGFHPELTGRENIFLYGSILGMSGAEIGRKFEEIISFSEIEKFVDTPVKRYSSGMYMRLAFSVAAHLEPEILLVDEVLAVGDAIFQRKCIKKMSEVAGGGRSVLFVSHNIPAMTSLCSRALILDGGGVSFCGDAPEAASRYLASVSEGAVKGSIAERSDRSGSGALRLTGFRLENSAGNRVAQLRNGETSRLVFEYVSPSGRPAEDVNFQFVLLKQTGEPVAQFGTRFAGRQFNKVPPAGEIVCEVKRLPLVPEVYRLDAYLSCGLVPADYISWLAQLNVADGDFYGSGYQVFEKESSFLLDGSVTLSPKQE